MAFARSGDFWSGLVLAALGAYIVVQARGWSYLGEEGPGAGFFPLWYGGAIVVLSLVLVAGAVARPARREPVRWGDVGRALGCWAAFVACIAAMPFLGFVLSFALLTWFIVKVMAGQGHRRALALAAGMALAFHALFVLALDLALPRGLLF